MKSVSGLCEDCLKEGQIVPAEEIHHIKPITQYNISDPNITLDWSNLVALCREHHRQRHINRPKPRYAIDEKGNVI